LAIAALVLASGSALGQEWTPQKDQQLEKQKSYSPYVDDHYPQRVYFGDTHHHSSFSVDAGMFGNTLGPDQSFRFARGEEVVSTDHGEYLGIADLLVKGDPQLLTTEAGKEWYAAMQEGGDAAWLTAVGMMDDFTTGNERVKDPKLKRTVWEGVVDIASKYNEPGVFTAFNGYEYSPAPNGDNLHRVVIFRDGPDRVKQVLPFSAFDSIDPEDLWTFMAKYEEKTGGQILAIPHNPNISNGLMFAETVKGKDMTRDYAERRSRWEPLTEVTQAKGDSEAHPFLSTEDEFADFETWDFGNAGTPITPKQNSMLQYEYIRSALQIGIRLEEKLGVNPFKFGMIGSTDNHISLSTTREDNYFGKLPSLEPSKDRINHTFVQNAYATTGSRITVRLFAGWDFKQDDIERHDFVEIGYKIGVSMGGDLSNAPTGKAPTFMVHALRDPQNANLDRIQIIKGWLDANGETHERIYDVAVSDGRKIESDGRCRTSVGNTVNIPDASYTNTIGDPLLSAYWIDPDFDPKQKAFYYVRVIEIPKPRWTAYDAKFFNIEMPEEVRMTVQDRAYTSPVWYTP
jgi:hypothetical protein